MEACIRSQQGRAQGDTKGPCLLSPPRRHTHTHTRARAHTHAHTQQLLAAHHGREHRECGAAFEEVHVATAPPTGGRLERQLRGAGRNEAPAGRAAGGYLWPGYATQMPHTPVSLVGPLVPRTRTRGPWTGLSLSTAKRHGLPRSISRAGVEGGGQGTCPAWALVGGCSEEGGVGWGSFR